MVKGLHEQPILHHTMRIFCYVVLKALSCLMDRFIMMLLKTWDSPTQSIGLACGKKLG
jgi:hypothetical protein